MTEYAVSAVDNSIASASGLGGAIEGQAVESLYHDGEKLVFEKDIYPALVQLIKWVKESSSNAQTVSTTLSKPASQKKCVSSTELQFLTSVISSGSQKSSLPVQHLLDLVASLLLRPCCTPTIIRHFRALLVDLCGRWLLALKDKAWASRIFTSTCTCVNEDTASGGSGASPKHDLDGNIVRSSIERDTDAQNLERILLAFSILLPTAPQVTLYAHLVSNIPSTIRVRSFVRSLYRLLRKDPLTFVPLISWTPIITILQHADAGVRVYSAHIMAVVLGMSDAERNQMIKRHSEASDPKEELRLLRIIEDEVDAEQEASMLMEASEETTDCRHNSIVITTSDLSLATVDMAGILLPSDPHRQGHSLVPTLTTRRNLHRIGLAVSLNVPTLLEGEAGVGKTALVEEAARLLGRHGSLLKIHLGDQTDAKVLLGTYICTSTPGSFRWQPGVLTTAVLEGRWILFEDIDQAPLEVISVLIPLLETNCLFVASRGERVIAKEGFRVFGTRTTGTHRSARTLAAGEGLWHKISVKALDQTEVVEVIQSRFPGLTELRLTDEILTAFELVNKLYQDKQRVGGRKVSLRDLIKWCTRVESATKHRTADTHKMEIDGEFHLPLSIREDVLRESADCFINSIPTKAFRDKALEQIGAVLGVAPHRVQFYTEVHVPHLQAGQETVVVGRVALPVRPRDPLQVSNQRPYAPTPSSVRLLESLSASIMHQEPLLLVGETGTGKTTVVQHLAYLTNTPLTVINMSQQSDSSDLLGGFKPIDVKALAASVFTEFDQIFAATFSAKANVAFLEGIRKSFKNARWAVFVKGCKMGVKMAEDIFAKMRGDKLSSSELPKKKKKSDKRVLDAELEYKWQKFGKTLATFDATQQKISASLLFSFIEGALVKAIREGHWILLDEINLATPETLDCLTGLLASATSSLVLLERGDTEPVHRHPGFRLFACMNPANDAGKKELSPGLRGRFTEIWVDAPDATFGDLVSIVKQYLQTVLPPAKAGEDICVDVATFYTTLRGYAAQGIVYDGADHRVHYSMRTLARALTFAVGTIVKGIWGLRRGLWEGCCMTFGTGLGDASREKMEAVLRETVGKGVNLNRGVKNPDAEGEVQRHIGVEGYYLTLGDVAASDPAEETYIITPTVQRNLSHLARAVMSGKYPVLIQGPTSAGKTSMVEYLARLTGHTCVRVNNHEGTEVAEYIGGWGEAEEVDGGSRGRLVWQEGILVTALRKGHWLILDELNLAPSDVLESLNRLLDDNRELFIPETQTTIRPHPNFMLFATQNPAGTTYGGRKQLSRAFRNRFLEIHFGDIPTAELHIILEKRCAIAPSYAKKVVGVYKALQSTRGRGRVFEGRHGFVTLRDLFRWAGRGSVGYEELAEEGWCLLGERMRSDEDRQIVKEVIEKEMKVQIDLDALYERGFEKVRREGLDNAEVAQLVDNMVWTPTTKRLFTLVWKCVSHNEPVLLVGVTGAGKTTVCQIVAAMCGKELRIVNAHQGSEVADFVGGMRPIRGRDEKVAEAWEAINSCRALLQIDSGEDNLEEAFRALKIASETTLNETDRAAIDRAKEMVDRCNTLFMWKDGPLTQSMREGAHFLLDEISLADDSVLERLNSVLEPSQSLLLSEKGRAESLSAVEGFRFLATMNPGGDYGKKELSPALRNRFCEVWVPGVTSRDDLDGLVVKKLTIGGVEQERATVLSTWIMDFYDWFSARLRKPRDAVVSLRDVLAWVEFITKLATSGVLTLEQAFLHGGCMVVVDGIGVNPAYGVVSGIEEMRKEVRGWLMHACSAISRESQVDEFGEGVGVVTDGDRFGVAPFNLQTGPIPPKEVRFSFMAPTTLRNLSRVLRALQLAKPVLLEGTPGVGKTSLVTTLAQLAGFNLTRINLSEQTDLTDLFGTDLPVEGTGNAGRFAWRDGPFLNAMKRGEWVLLDELNLASQQVLEGLNACLDHRGEVYVPELDRVFKKGANFRVFAAQNPQGQGGGRKGLPRSFVNRFTTVYVEALTEADVGQIVSGVFGAGVEVETIEKLVRFNERMKEETMEKMRFGSRGAPWEFNLRDVVRWVDLVKTGGQPRLFLEMMYAQRMRTPQDREKVRALFDDVFGDGPEELRRPQWRVTDNLVSIGAASMERRANRAGYGTQGSVPIDRLHVIPSALPTLETLLKCVEMGYMPILTGPAGSGKTGLIRLLAGMCGVTLKEFSMNPGVDSVELLGGFEQADLVRRRKATFEAIHRVAEVAVRQLVAGGNEEVVLGKQVMMEWDTLRSTDETSIDGLRDFAGRLEALVSHLRIDLIERSLPTFESIRDLIIAYEDTILHGTHGTFEWVDGTLIKAMEEGHWILLDNVNLCPSSVLDRLNPLLESGGVLNVTERGLDASGEIRIVGQRNGFRIFMCLDDRFGEVSRAMRNRGVEIYVDDILNHDEADRSRLLGGGALSTLVASSTEAQEESAALNIRQLGMVGRLAAERAQRGDSISDAIRSSLAEVRDGAHEIVHQALRTSDGFAAPMIFPQFISGNFVLEESELAQIAVDGAYLQFLMATNPHTSERAALFLAAAKVFVEGTTTGSLEVRKTWVSHVAGSVQAQDQIANHALKLAEAALNMPSTDLQVFREAVVPSEALRQLPVDLRHLRLRVGEIVKERPEWRPYVDALRLQDLARRLVWIDVTDENAAQSLGVEISVLEKSRLHSCLKIGESELEHPVVATLYPLMGALRAAFEHWMKHQDYHAYITANMSKVEAILDQRDVLWTCLQSPDVPFEEVFTALRRLRKACTACELCTVKNDSDENVIQLNTILAQALDLIGADGFEGMSLLWKRGSVSVLKDRELFDLEQAFRGVNQQFQIWNAAFPHFWGGVGHPALLIDEVVKKSIMDGVATLYYLNEDAGASGKAEFLNILQRVPETVIGRISSLTSEIEADAEAISADKHIEAASLVEIRGRVALDVVTKYASRASKLGLWGLLDASSLISELVILNRLGEVVAGGVTKADLSQLVEPMKRHQQMVLAQTSRAPLDIEPMQRLIWLCESGPLTDNELRSFAVSIHLDASYRWHRALWSNGSSFWAEQMEDSDALRALNCDVLDIIRGKTVLQPSDQRYGGPVMLEGGSASRFCLYLSGASRDVPLYGYAGKVNQLRGVTNYLASDLSSSNKIDVAVEDMKMLMTNITQFLRNHEKAFTSDIHQEIMRLVNLMKDALLDGQTTVGTSHAAELSSLLEMSTSQVARSRLVHYMRPCLAAISSCSPTQPDEKFLRDIPVDPASGPAVKLKFMEQNAATLRAELHVRSEVDRLLTGNRENELTQELRSRLKKVTSRRQGWAARVALRPERPQMKEIITDLRQLGSHILADQSVSGLMEDLSQNTLAQGALAKESHLQDTLAALVDRLETKYPLYRDILQPIYLGVYQLKYGLRLMVQSLRQRLRAERVSTEELVKSTIRFIDVCSLDNLENQLRDYKSLMPVEDAHQQYQHNVEIVTAFLARAEASLHLRSVVSLPTLQATHVLFANLVDTWSAVEQRKVDKAKTDAELYKYKEQKHDLLTEDELEEVEFRERFPDFYAEYDTGNATAAANEKETTDVPENVFEFDTKIAQDIRLHHRNIVASWNGQKNDAVRIEKIWHDTFMKSYQSGARLVRALRMLPPRDVDVVGHGGLFYASATVLRDFVSASSDTEQEADGAAGQYDFYRDENIPEARRILDLLSALDGRVGELLSQWPEHAVLGQISALCERIVSFSVAAPVMKLLTGLEILLQKCQDWEAYASRDVSLKVHMDAIVLLIVQWRKLELKSWRELLEVEDRKSQQDASGLWFHLWKTVFGLAMDPAVESQVNGETTEDLPVQDLLATLDHFCLGSALGQFETRLDMIHVFHQHLLAVAPTVTDSAQRRIRVVANVLHNVFRYYSLFVAQVKSTIEQQRKPIWKELNGYVQIATWKDVNVYALQESAKRTHYHLNKFIKRYRVILNLPVRQAVTAFHDILQISNEDAQDRLASLISRTAKAAENITAMTPVSGLTATDIARPPARTSETTSKIEHFVKRMKKHCSAMVAEHAGQTGSEGVDELATTILERIKAFQAINADLKGGSKMAKSQQSVRKMALVDLLKYLAFLGLSPRCTQKYLEQRESSFICTLHEIKMNRKLLLSGRDAQIWLGKDLADVWEKADHYFYRVVAKMSKVRELEITASADLSRSEVEKAVSYLEHLLHQSIEERRVFAASADSLRNLKAIGAQMDVLFSRTRTGRDGPASSRVVVDLLSGEKDLIDEALLVVTQACMLYTTHMKAGNQPIVSNPLEKSRQVLTTLKEVVDTTFTRHVVNGVPTMAVQDMVHAATERIGTVGELVVSIEHFSSTAGVQAYVPKQAAELLRSKLAAQTSRTNEIVKSVPEQCDEQSALSRDFMESVDALVKTILVAFQGLQKTATANANGTPMEIVDEEAEDFGLRKRHFMDAHKQLCVHAASRPMAAIFEAVCHVTRVLDANVRLADDLSREHLETLISVYPLLSQYLLAFEYRLFEGILHHKSTLKLAYILCNTFGSLFKDGFCVPKDQKDDGNEDEGDEGENVAGTGIGEGEGKKDVSDEIENEGQVEEMKNNNAAPEPDKKIEDEDDGIEMDADFEGKLEDLDMNDQEDDDDAEDNDQGEEADEQMGDIDDNAEVLDEKMWGEDDKDEAGDGKDEKMEKDAPAKDSAGEIEMAAKEDAGEDEQNKEKEKNQPEKDKQGDANTAPEEKDDGEDDDQINEDHEDKYEENHGVDMKPADQPEEQPPKEEGAEEEDADLPDQMEIDDADENDENTQDQTETQKGGGDDETKADMETTSHEEIGPEDPDSDLMEDELQLPDEANEEEGGNPEPESLAEPEDETEEMVAEDLEKQNIPESANGVEEPPAQQDEQTEQGPEQDQSQAVDDAVEQSTQPFGVQGASGEKSSANMQNETMDEELAEQGADANADSSARGTDRKDRQAKSTPTEQRNSENRDPNPRRSVGDALKKWLSRLKNISDSPSDEPDNDSKQKQDEAIGDEAMDFEFVKEDEESADAQAMGDATAQQMAEMDTKALADDKEEAEYDADDPDEVIPETDPDTEEPIEKSQPDRPSGTRNEKPSGAIDLGKNQSDEKDDEEPSSSKKEVDGEQAMDTDDTDALPVTDDTRQSGKEEPPSEEDRLDDEEILPSLDTKAYEELRHELERTVAEWRESGQDPVEAQELWRNYITLTRDLSYALCEQLRLILEPTLATKLMGDYRTGKRLNMRKIIPYIASQFKKDKIWMRRTKPSKRTYQIMIAIDDSRSMAESRSVQLAYESLAVITKALTQLEAGDVSVLSFGEDINLLHPFDQPFSDEAGGDVLRRFTFGQDRTNVQSMMETAMGVLDHARSMASGNGADLWQLQLVLSDGLCEDHELVRALVRQAAEQRIMVVFIVLDNRPEKDSIVKMTNVTYGTDRATGRPTLQMNRYMDTFPFDYYVVVKDVEHLPEVLADTLRQYFMFVS
ncbi:uncharacterized protein EV422DRAFT_572412 [Fimicolochytrium jonesii]|uniref:uncharacterized protein n=1 Tax=Fimicolochytrium jonesii TaxID=1396493 RepID=UPI0022FDCEA0|nr:uncharacterized protein EV422DRAFT_572412 [Fimicolochytrium jonesii]KAI8815825.1 hypothetical protein EV422DRAFT_572412 [Fimicolochytrium jonesii]